MKRSVFLRKLDDKAREARLSVPLKRRKCKACPETFMTTQGFRNWCSPQCGLKLSDIKLEKALKAEAIADRAKTRASLEAIKTLPMLKSEAQKAFNAYIRLRDAKRNCICCEYRYMSESVLGGAFDAGHYRSVGSAPHLRFDERNVHGQLKHCNKYLGGNVVNYRRGLIERIGLSAVEALEADQTPRKYTRDELRAIRDEYRARVRTMKKEIS